MEVRGGDLEDVIPGCGEGSMRYRLSGKLERDHSGAAHLGPAYGDGAAVAGRIGDGGGVHAGVRKGHVLIGDQGDLRRLAGGPGGRELVTQQRQAAEEGRYL